MEPEPQEVNGTFNLEFEIVDDSSKRGRPKLVDNRGYSYNIQRCRGENTDWQCTVRPKVYNYILFIMFTIYYELITRESETILPLFLPHSFSSSSLVFGIKIYKTIINAGLLRDLTLGVSHDHYHKTTVTHKKA